jgi:hypothetical protein
VKKAEKEDLINRTMRFIHKRKYGVNYYYPANKLAEDALKTFTQRSRSKCFTVQQVSFFKYIGVKIVLVADDEHGLQQ